METDSGACEKSCSDGWRRRYRSDGRIIGVSSEAHVAGRDCGRSIEIMKASGNPPVR